MLPARHDDDDNVKVRVTYVGAILVPIAVPRVRM